MEMYVYSNIKQGTEIALNLEFEVLCWVYLGIQI